MLFDSNWIFINFFLPITRLRRLIFVIFCLQVPMALEDQQERDALYESLKRFERFVNNQ